MEKKMRFKSYLILLTVTTNGSTTVAKKFGYVLMTTMQRIMTKTCRVEIFIAAETLRQRLCDDETDQLMEMRWVNSLCD